MTVTQPTGVHHLAISTANVKTQIEFFTQVLGAKLVALYWMHGVEAWHAFVELNPSCSIAFVEMTANGEIDAIPGVTHSGTPADPSAPGTMQHVAFNADDLDQLLRLRDRIRNHGVTVLGPVDHGMCQSIYFGGPEGLTLEVATSPTAIPAGEPGSMAQPPLDTTRPALGYPEEVLAILAAMSDDDVAASMNYPDPPVPTPGAS
jgi:catechol 2,3-dioxygenase-like lactoylglutathione lyase family enzyme